MTLETPLRTNNPRACVVVVGPSTSSTKNRDVPINILAVGRGILCARSPSRSNQQSTKRGSRSKSMQTVCSVYSQNAMEY